jgi:xanthine dehydrogenase accessory factor
MTHQRLVQQARAWLDAGVPVMLVQVLAARGSVPRGTGTRMLVTAQAQAGSIGGGQLEWQALAEARALLQGAGAAPLERDIALGPTLGQCCGGALRLRYARLAPQGADAPEAWPLPPPRFTLYLYGAGHVGRALVRLLADLPCAVHWIDEREAEFPPGPLPPHIRRVCVDTVEAEAAAAPPGAWHLVMTHSHLLDMAIVQQLLARGDFGWLGLIGSRSKRARFEARLRQRGVAAAELQRIRCPVGLPGITGKEPEVVALAVAAQLLQQAPPADAG